MEFVRIRLILINFYMLELLTTLVLVPVNKRVIQRTIMSSAITQSSNSHFMPLDSWGLSCENSWPKYLKAENREKTTHKAQFIPREVRNAHFSFVQMESVPTPYFIAASDSCARDIGLDPEEFKNPKFTQVFSGNELLPGLDDPYCTVYGCHSYGQWFGQLGDGRAMGLGEVKVANDQNGTEERYELQLKGCGRSPYSRGFDGRAVLRSSVREFLVSEAMHHLGIPTTRALSLIGTGQKIQRAWYADNSTSRIVELEDSLSPNPTITARTQKYAPNRQIIEPGAVVCRVSRSFLRFTHLELFNKRNEYDELMMMADFVCFREFPHLLDMKINEDEKLSASSDKLSRGTPERYVELFREVTKNNAILIAEWLRVGYVQGNMNSDNTCLAGRTIDYGPFGWMEKYDPFYQPFTSDPSGNFAYIRQPTAMSVNLITLAETFETIVTQACKITYGDKNNARKYIDEIKSITENEYRRYFFDAFNEVQRKKLGLKLFDEEQDSELWSQLDILMARSGCDHTILFRELISAASKSTADDALLALESSFYDSSVIAPLNKQRDEWIAWLSIYLDRIKTDARPIEERVAEQRIANPKFVLRNWMSILAYERAEKGDFSITNELQELLKHSYDEHSPEITEKWYSKTPSWATNMPGATFMSCSS